MSSPQTITANIAALRQRIVQSASDAGRDPAEITLLAVSKTRSAEEVAVALDAGLTQIGENYLQEAVDKQAALQGRNACWHFIGPIQSNKTREIASHFDWVHSVDREKIARRLSEQRPEGKPPLKICLQVNISREDSKSGVLPEDALTLAKQITALPALQLRGLMAIPAASDDPAEQRAAFAALRALRDTLQQALPDQTLDTLSMGMSGDMDAAIAEGSTLIRIGTALFGPRPAKAE
ncbi:YggS family pyridoxal phosphate-dependent enzyme [Spongiibacter tropicus]|uniref:YggS family pyridoxal phosphate-dependent enzyme n=1 Tax=Spongiibacter tropicus TaxID=454602 RepID=UPI0023573626|nr:YggS family pyridoxal phosphate-dependent enzyme [Spongiibacter tropicus]|tara:strand:- start:7397 stop:8107 length:711 start_codon:yes stop_codon:yes gene_type:complete